MLPFYLIAMVSERCSEQSDSPTTEITEASLPSDAPTDHTHTCLDGSDDHGASTACPCNTLLFFQVLLGILCAFKPAEPFVVPYYIDNGISMEQINQVVFPTSGYSNFGFLLVLSLVSIAISHHALLYLGWIGYVACYTLLVFVDKLVIAIFDEIFYGLAVASETVYCAAFYFLKNRNVSEETSQLRASAISRTTLLVTHVVSDLSGQLMVSFIPDFSKRLLFIITAISVSFSLVPLTVITCLQRRLKNHPFNGVLQNKDVYSSVVNTERMTRKLYLRGLSYVWGGGIAGTLPLYIGIFSLSGHTLYQNYITNILYDVQQGSDSELYGLFVMAGRLSGVLGSVLALACRRVKRVEALQLFLLLTLSCLLIVPAFVQHLSWLFAANIAEFAVAELTITVMWAQLAASCQLTIYPAVFLCQALVVAAIVLVVQATVFNNVASKLGGFTVNQTHYFWCAILGLAGLSVSLLVSLVTRLKRRCKESDKNNMPRVRYDEKIEPNETSPLPPDPSCEV